MSYPNTNLHGLIGFAKAANVTGGQGGPVVYVSTAEQLKSAVAGSDSRIVVIAQSIRVSQLTKLQLGSNKSIIGSFEGNNVLKNIHFRSWLNSGNIIFQNIVFQHDESINGNDDIQLYLTTGKGYWIDHCLWIGHSWSKNDSSLDKLIYIGEKADYATISNCYFKDHKYGCIFGYPAESHQEYDGYPHLTVCHNYYHNIHVRSPGLMRYGYYHAFNNCVENFNLSFTIISYAKVVSEANYFIGDSPNAGLDDKGEGATFSDFGSIPDIKPVLSAPSNWTPGSNYSYNLMSADEARRWTSANAGAKYTENEFIFPV